jgi:hypothetical protein
MLEKLQPNEIVDSIYEINLSNLKGKGIRAVIADLDNTLVPWRSTEIKDTLTAWVKDVKDAGLNLAIVSNNTSSRVHTLSEQLGVIAVSKAVKPRRRAFRNIASQFSLDPSEIAVVGDQLLTDVLGGNRTGMYTILVTPISKHEFIGTKLIRQIERFFLKLLPKNVK